ncbi:unnamed protein product [Penicillium camemberti]|uniref:Str. FM013 n=1 Tax=Penicillium camemberti (strain FM 013) TaxID=1429867 RepID=A0A0G4P3G2_PENC3|nr:unnamed protein product [Penicillium camemberti]
MQFTVSSLIVALAATTTALRFKQPVQDICVDLTKPLTLQWTHSSDDPSDISCVLWNFSGAFPNVDESFPIGGSTPLVVSSSLETVTLPAISPELAERFSENNNGKKYQVNAVPAGRSDILDQWGFFTVAKPGGGCSPS